MTVATDLRPLADGNADYAAIVDFEFANVTFSRQRSKAVIGLYFLEANSRKIGMISGEGLKNISGTGQKEDYLSDFIARDQALMELINRLPSIVAQ